MNKVNKFYETIKSLDEEDRNPRHAMLLPALAGVGFGYLTKLLFGHPNQDKIINEISRN